MRPLYDIGFAIVGIALGVVEWCTALVCRIGVHYWRLVDDYPLADTARVKELYCDGCDTWRRRIVWRDGRKETRDIQFRAWGVEVQEE